MSSLVRIAENKEKLNLFFLWPSQKHVCHFEIRGRFLLIIKIYKCLRSLWLVIGSNVSNFKYRKKSKIPPPYYKMRKSSRTRRRPVYCSLVRLALWYQLLLCLSGLILYSCYQSQRYPAVYLPGLVSLCHSVPPPHPCAATILHGLQYLSSHRRSLSFSSCSVSTLL